jgi:hypothetical protein
MTVLRKSKKTKKDNTMLSADDPRNPYRDMGCPCRVWQARLIWQAHANDPKSTVKIPEGALDL